MGQLARGGVVLADALWAFGLVALCGVLAPSHCVRIVVFAASGPALMLSCVDVMP